MAEFNEYREILKNAYAVRAANYRNVRQYQTKKIRTTY